MSNFFKIFNNMVICSSNKSKKNELEHPPKVIWPNLRGAPMLNNIQTNRRHQTRLKRKQARDDENFIESLIPKLNPI